MAGRLASAVLGHHAEAEILSSATGRAQDEVMAGCRALSGLKREQWWFPRFDRWTLPGDLAAKANGGGVPDPDKFEAVGLGVVEARSPRVCRRCIRPIPASAARHLPPLGGPRANSGSLTTGN